MSGPQHRARLREARDAMYREVILDAAEEVFAESGFVASKVQSMAALAGVSTRTLYTMFDGKGGLFAAVHERRGRALLAVVAKHPHARGPGLERLLGGVAAYSVYLMEHPSYLRLLGHAKVWTSHEALPSQPQAETAAAGIDLVSAAFAEAIDDGLLRAEDPVLLTRLMHAMHQVRLLDWLDRGMLEPPSAVARRLQEELICAFGRPERIGELLRTVLPRVAPAERVSAAG